MPDREVLRSAVLAVLPVNTAITWDSAERLADAIVDAVMAVADEGGKEEWGARCLNNRCAAAGKIYHRHTSRDKTEQSMAQAEDGHFELVRRRHWVSDWEAAT